MSVCKYANQRNKKSIKMIN